MLPLNPGRPRPAVRPYYEGLPAEGCMIADDEGWPEAAWMGRPEKRSGHAARKHGPRGQETAANEPRPDGLGGAPKGAASSRKEKEGGRTCCRLRRPRRATPSFARCKERDDGFPEAAKNTGDGARLELVLPKSGDG